MQEKTICQLLGATDVVDVAAVKEGKNAAIDGSICVKVGRFCDTTSHVIIDYAAKYLCMRWHHW